MLSWVKRLGVNNHAAFSNDALRQVNMLVEQV